MFSVNGRYYPHEVKTGFGVRPDAVAATNRFGHFLCVPDPTERTKKWGFESEAAAELFALEYKEHVVD